MLYQYTHTITELHRFDYFVLFCHSISQNKISTRFFAVTANKVYLFIFWRKKILRYDWSYYLENIKWLYQSYWNFIYIFNYFIFQDLILNRLSADTETVIAKGIFGDLILAKVRHKKITPSYCLFFETKWRRSGAHVNHLFFSLGFINSSTQLALLYQ